MGILTRIIVFLSFIFYVILGVGYCGTCSSITRTNYVANSVLTSTALNADFNQLLDAGSHGLNDFDGGCVTDGTLEDGALNTTDYAVLLNGVTQGCRVRYSDAATISIGKCFASVNGNFVNKTTATTATWGCTGCSSEVASTTYYVYIKNGSLSSTLTPLISSTAPNDDGYDSNSNKILARFYNNGYGNISSYSIDQWIEKRFIPSNTDWISYTLTIGATTTAPTLGTIVTNTAKWRRVGDSMQINYSLAQSSGSNAGSGTYLFPLPAVGDVVDITKIGTGTSNTGGINIVGHFNAGNTISDDADTSYPGIMKPFNATNLYATFNAIGANRNSIFDSGDAGFYSGAAHTGFTALVPIAGWSSE